MFPAVFFGNDREKILAIGDNRGKYLYPRFHFDKIEIFIRMFSASQPEETPFLSPFSSRGKKMRKDGDL